MNLQQLYYFRKLAEVQHYTKAAKALYITQPSLSDSISSLESELSVALFQKKGRGIELTKYGQEFSIAGRINRSSKAAIVANTPFLKQFDNLKKIHLTDVPLGTRMIYMVYSKKNFITATVESFANFIVAHCLDLPPES